MQQSHRILALTGIALFLAAMYLLPPNQSHKAHRKAVRVQSLNRLDSVTFIIETNTPVTGQSQLY